MRASEVTLDVYEKVGFTLVLGGVGRSGFLEFSLEHF